MALKEFEKKWANMSRSDRLIFWSSLSPEQQNRLFSLRSGNDMRFAILRKESPERISELFNLLPDVIKLCLYARLTEEERENVNFVFRPSLRIPAFYVLSFFELEEEIEKLNSFDKAQVWDALDEGTRFELWCRSPNLKKEFKL